ncbi:protein DpdE [Streptomyces sp. NBC_01381]|uniref:protein DpdE n=1 Tax=Streptomyces sp. NBC_01381 TaxID=2903845 RepID=UPI00225B8E93|nr:protein DpdE [Streptomyces sp. NBC_01381]MCX4666522.1 protein DpdE [Streptomyces sp. NBC_01381]
MSTVIRAGGGDQKMSSGFAVGHLVEFQGGPGIGRVGAITDGSLRVDFFESRAEHTVGSQTVPAIACRRVRLEPETRVSHYDRSTGEWKNGRVVGRAPAPHDYSVRYPNSELDDLVYEADLRVRWNKPVGDPIQVLVVGGNESGHLYNARIPLLHNLVAQRAASASTPAFLAAAAEIYPHQVRAALTVLSDPVQRYLLADEVGLGKTIEAGYVGLQTLIDNPQARVVFLVPDALRLQWLAELRTKFFTDDFRPRVKVISHDSPEVWERHHDSDLVVVDEAHQLVQDRDNTDPTYRALCELAHSASKLLLLSATPVTSSHTTHLGLLHLLDADMYKWSDLERFAQRYNDRAELANHVLGLNADFHPLLPSTIDIIKAMLPPEDTRFDELAAHVLGLLDPEGDLRDGTELQELTTRVTELRAHISETYRLHRRVIRHRRSRVLNRNDDSAGIPYEVRGRTEPTRLSAESYGPAADNLLEWQTQLWGHLLDEGLDRERDSYALALAVLASRLGGTSADYLDALRWRVHRDEDAAQRAGLSSRERDHLANPPVAPHESESLQSLESQIAEGHWATEIDDLITTLLPALSRRGRTIAFCGPGTLASKLTERLRTRFPKVAFFEHTRSAGSEASEDAITAWRGHAAKDGAAVLITDDSAEDGLNLQVAQRVIHVRLPWSPNQLEQRIGRTDRYVESREQRQKPNQFVLTDAEAHTEAWLSLLIHGYRVFAENESVSTLQDAIAQGLADVWAQALEHGPEGLVDFTETVQEQLDKARREIDKMDTLETVFDASPHDIDFAEQLATFEADWGSTRAAMLGFTGRDGSLGIKLRHTERKLNGVMCEVFDIRSRTLISPHLYDRKSLTAETATGTFSRSEALKAPGTRLFRIGNPLVDTLANVVWCDDRGQATAFWRADASYRGEPEPYFGFDFVVEADIASALKLALPLVANPRDAEEALRRQAEQLLPSFTLKVWVPAGASEALPDGATRAWLDAPYGAGDHNYNPGNIHELMDLFDGQPGYEASARGAETIARAELRHVTDLAKKCEQAQKLGRERLTVMRVQAEARRAAGRLLGDGESYRVDVAITEALVQGLSDPRIQLVSATCLLKTGLRRVRRGN